MKKLLIGFVAIAAVIALPPLFKRASRKMSEHCEQMMAAQGSAGEAAWNLHEHFEQQDPQFRSDREAVGAA